MKGRASERTDLQADAQGVGSYAGAIDVGAAPVASAMTGDVPRAYAILAKIFAFYRAPGRRATSASECLRLVAGNGPRQVERLLAQLPPAWADHAIASVYALHMRSDRRKRLGAYFTPPHVVDHLLGRMNDFGLDLGTHSIRDPAAGGAAFLVPVARQMVAMWRSEALSPAAIVDRLCNRLLGREIDPELAAIANALLRRSLVREFSIRQERAARVALVTVGNSLVGEWVDGAHHEVGNPPYFRMSAAGQRRWKKQFADIGSGRLNLYAMFVYRGLLALPAGGLLGHVLPLSFLGGPEFSAFRCRVLQLAEVLAIDTIERRREVFLDAIQDACFLVLRRRSAIVDDPPLSTASSGVLQSGGTFRLAGKAALRGDGSPWTLPGKRSVGGTATLADYGYRGTIGHLVANREPHRLHARPAAGRLPLAWAKSITAEGRFDFDRGRNTTKAAGRGYVTVSPNASYAIRVPCVLVQRTSSRSQTKRLCAAAVPSTFLRKHGGIVGENHVILLVRSGPGAVSPAALARVLNGPEATAALARVSGSASISVRVLESLRLPRPRAPGKGDRR